MSGSGAPFQAGKEIPSLITSPNPVLLRASVVGCWSRGWALVGIDIPFLPHAHLVHFPGAVTRKHHAYTYETAMQILPLPGTVGRLFNDYMLTALRERLHQTCLLDSLCQCAVAVGGPSDSKARLTFHSSASASSATTSLLNPWEASACATRKDRDKRQFN